MKRYLIAILMATAFTGASAQLSPLGLWRTVDDKSGEPRAEVRITERGGLLFGHIENRLGKDIKPDDKCDECRDDRKDKPILGLEIIRGARKAEGRDVWEDGKILDPENGRNYTLRLMPVEGGRKLEVRGYLGPFWRTQTWIRAQ